MVQSSKVHAQSGIEHCRDMHDSFQSFPSSPQIIPFFGYQASTMDCIQQLLFREYFVKADFFGAINILLSEFRKLGEVSVFDGNFRQIRFYFDFLLQNSAFDK